MIKIILTVRRVILWYPISEINLKFSKAVHLMPELPEVETVARELSRSEITHSLIQEVFVFWDKTVSLESQVFCEKMKSKKILSVSRRGKYLIFTLDAPYSLLVHLRMSGQFFIRKDSRRRPHEHVIFSFASGFSLHFHDPRKFGRMYVSNDLPLFFSHLGIEPLSDEFTFEQFSLRMKKNRSIKALLLDQSVIAGLGNIYVDESLWQAGIHPLEKASSLSEERKLALWKAIPEVLLRGLTFGGTSLGKGLGNFHTVNGQVGEHQNHLHVFQRQEKACVRCQNLIVKMVVAQRGTHICPFCQRLEVFETMGKS